ncbi:MAG: hypothetical protein WBP52_02820 [Terriglobales bacterium]
MLDEVLNLVAGGISERLRAAEVDGVGLYEFGVEFVLADDLAETVANLGSAAIPIAVRVLGRKLFNPIRKRADFLDRSDADAVGLPQSAIDGTGFGHAHLRPADERGNIGRIRVAVADKAR